MSKVFLLFSDLTRATFTEYLGAGIQALFPVFFLAGTCSIKIHFLIMLFFIITLNKLTLFYI